MYPELDKAVKFLSNVLDSYSTVFLAVDQGRLKVVSYHSLGNIAYRRSVPLADSGVYAVVLKKQRPISIDNYDRDATEFFFYKEDPQIKSVAIFPVGKSGIFHVDSKRSYLFTDRAMKIVKEFVGIVEDLMECIAFKLERKGLFFTLNVLEKGLSYAIKGDIRGLMEILAREAKADVAFFAVERDGNIFMKEFIPEEFKEERPISKNSILQKIFSSGKPFFSDKADELDDPIFWEYSHLKDGVKSLLCVPCAGGYLGFCKLKGSKHGNIKLLMNPLEILVPLLGRRSFPKDMDPVTGFLSGSSFERLAGGLDGHMLDVKLLNIVEIYESLGPSGGDEFLKRFSEVLKKVVSSRIKFRVFFGRLGPHHFRVFVPGDLGEVRDLMKLLRMAFGNLSVCVGSKSVRPNIELRHIC